MNEIMNGMLGKVAPGMCRLSMQGGIAIRTADGYKSYDAATGRMVNCENFVFPVGEEFFFVIPTNRVKKGDIILAGGKPKYVLESEKNRITALNYETSVIENILPERYLFLGNTYFYGKIVSMFGNKGITGGKGVGKILKYMMLGQLLKGNSAGGTVSGSGSGGGLFGGNGGKMDLLPLMFLAGGKDSGLGDLFDFDFDDEEDDGIADADTDA